MQRQIRVAFLPSLWAPADLSQQSVIVTDVLRASTTMIAALHHGAQDIIPIAEIPEALKRREALREAAATAGPAAPEIVLGGERRGVIIPGFDQGNSPLEFTPDVIGGRRLILCTTNGTVAVERCRGAGRVIIGALVNLQAVAESLARDELVAIVCAGTAGQVTGEDVLFAGALAERLAAMGGPCHLDDQASIARDAWQAACHRVTQGISLSAQLAVTRGGRNLMDLGYRADIDFCAQIDALPLVPELDPAQWSIRLPNAR